MFDGYLDFWLTGGPTGGFAFESPRNNVTPTMFIDHPMPLQFLQRFSGSKKTFSLEVVPLRFCQVFQDHGVEKSQIPRLIPQIKLNDLKTNEALLAALTSEILDQTARLFGVRLEWLEGVDDEIYPYRYCYKSPELLLELLATLRNHADFDSNHFPLRVLVSDRHLDRKVGRTQLLVPVVLEKIAELGDEPIYRYYIFSDGFDWAYEPARIQLKAMVRLAYKALRVPVDLGRRCAWVHPDQAKARKAIAVPLSNAAVVVMRGQIGKHSTHVFSYRGNPIDNPNNSAWAKSLKRAAIEQFRWHDLRHTWASWHVQAGTPLHVLQELGGWESVEMVRRYAHLSSEHLADYVDRLSGLQALEGNGGYVLATVAEMKRG